jgi:hypothetical protein
LKIIKKGKDISECLCQGVAEEFIWALQLGWIVLVCDICHKEINPKELLLGRPLGAPEGWSYYHLHNECFTKRLNSVKAIISI